MYSSIFPLGWRTWHITNLKLTDNRIWRYFPSTNLELSKKPYIEKPHVKPHIIWPLLVESLLGPSPTLSCFIIGPWWRPTFGRIIKKIDYEKLISLIQKRDYENYEKWLPNPLLPLIQKQWQVKSTSPSETWSFAACWRLLTIHVYITRLL